MVLWVVVIVCLILFILVRPYFFRYDTACALTGTMGSGKTFLGVNALSIVELHKARVKWRFKNLFRKRSDKLPKPLLYSNIPIRISKNEWSERLTLNHILLIDKQVEGSITFFDEVDFFANQFEFKNPNLRRNGDIGGAFDEYVRLYRHYIGGHLFVTSQSSDNIVLNIRRRLNNVYNLFDFRTYGLPFFKIFYTVKVRNISISEDIKTISVGQLEDDYSVRYGFLPLRRKYATRCFKHRYDSLDLAQSTTWHDYYTNENMNLPDSIILSKTNKSD